MTSPTTLNWLRTGMICGIFACICYILAIFVSLPFRIDYLIFFAFGPFMIAATVGLYHYLRALHDGIALQLGVIFLGCAGITVTMMATMQGMIRGHYRESRALAETEIEKAEAITHFLAVDSTQQGLDMAFDIFISTGSFLFAFALLKVPRFGVMYAGSGMLIAAIGLFLNAISFPEVNAGEAGYIDPAPFFGVYFSILSLKFVREWIRIERGTTATQ